MGDIKDKLKSLLDRHAIMTGADWRGRIAELERERQAGTFEIDKIVPGEIIKNSAGAFYCVRHQFPLHTLQGTITLGAALDARPEHIAFSANDADLEAFDPRTALFVDIETTGLAGGTGTTAFLVGIGRFSADAFLLDQCFMRDFDEEEAMLRYLENLFRQGETAVTYNGKSFDIPLLRTRFIANRIPYRLDAGLHYDLVHVARRFWKDRLRDCSLGNVERHILGVERQGDVNSAEIPQLWFDYLRTRDARKLEQVFHHHKLDILSLAALTGWLSQRLEIPEGEGFDHSQDKLSLVRLHFRQKRYEDAYITARRVLNEETAEALRYECLEWMGCACKKLSDWTRAGEAWEQMLQEFPRSVAPRLELAKLFEHRTRDLERALELCEDTLRFLSTRTELGHTSELDAWRADEFRRRAQRLRRKMERASTPPAETREQDKLRE